MNATQQQIQRGDAVNAAEQKIVMLARMYECRNAARQIMGDRYHDKMIELAQVIKAVAKRDDCSYVKAGMTVITSGELEVAQALMIMAAVVEMTEPSNPN